MKIKTKNEVVGVVYGRYVKRVKESRREAEGVVDVRVSLFMQNNNNLNSCRSIITLIP